MAKTTSFNLGDHFEQFISKQVKSGRYGNASEVVRASLRAMEEQEQELAALRQKLIAAEEGGMSERTPAQIRNEAKVRLKQDV